LCVYRNGRRTRIDGETAMDHVRANARGECAVVTRRRRYVKQRRSSCGKIETERSNMISELDVIILMCQIAFSRAGGRGEESIKGVPSVPSRLVGSMRSEYLRVSSSTFPFFSTFSLSLLLCFFFSSLVPLLLFFVIYNQCNYVHAVPNIIL